MQSYRGTVVMKNPAAVCQKVCVMCTLFMTGDVKNCLQLQFGNTDVFIFAYFDIVKNL